jgi:Polyketide cyclase / dehydrase and lipid transport
MTKPRPRLLPVLQIVILALIAVALLLAGVGALLPRHWRVERSIMINAPPAVIHRWAGDLRHWSRWAQWDQTALAPKNEIGEPSAGVGARLVWYGRAGSEESQGEVRIVQSDPARGVWFEHRISDGEPSRAELRYAPKPGVTEVIWLDEGQLPPVVGGLFLDYFQTRLAQHMGEGLARLKDLVEHQNPAEPGPSRAPARTEPARRE